MALVDSEAAFSEHCASVGAPASVIRALRNAGITTFAGLAFHVALRKIHLLMRRFVILQIHCLPQNLQSEKWQPSEESSSKLPHSW